MHTFIPEYIYIFINYIINATQTQDEFYSLANEIIFSIGYFINICCIIIFNEVVILNFCGMDYNTKKRIEERERNDSKNNMIALNILMNEENEH